MLPPIPPPRPPSWVPIRKVSVAAISASASVIALWILDLSGVFVPPTVAAAITGILSAGMAYLIPSGSEEFYGRHAIPSSEAGDG